MCSDWRAVRALIYSNYMLLVTPWNAVQLRIDWCFCFSFSSLRHDFLVPSTLQHFIFTILAVIRENLKYWTDFLMIKVFNRTEQGNNIMYKVMKTLCFHNIRAWYLSFSDLNFYLFNSVFVYSNSCSNLFFKIYCNIYCSIDVSVSCNLNESLKWLPSVKSMNALIFFFNFPLHRVVRVLNFF